MKTVINYVIGSVVVVLAAVAGAMLANDMIIGFAVAVFAAALTLFVVDELNQLQLQVNESADTDSYSWPRFGNRLYPVDQIRCLEVAQSGDKWHVYVQFLSDDKFRVSTDGFGTEKSAMNFAEGMTIGLRGMT